MFGDIRESVLGCWSDLPWSCPPRASLTSFLAFAGEVRAKPGTVVAKTPMMWRIVRETLSKKFSGR